MGRTYSAEGLVASPIERLVVPSSSDIKYRILFPSPSQTALLTALELLKSHEVPFDKSVTYSPRAVLCFVNEYSDRVYKARVPAEFGSAVPRRGALISASGVKRVELVANEIDITESTMATKLTGDLIENRVLDTATLWNDTRQT